MGKFPKGGLLGRLVSLWQRLREMNISGHAANAGYFIVLSVFPMLVLILSVLRYTQLDARDLLRVLEGFLPEALLPAAQKLIVSTYAHTSTAVVSVSAVSALWSASRGVYGLITGLNAIYGVREDRGYLYTRGLSVVYTFALVLVLLLTLVLNVFGEALIRFLNTQNSVFWRLLYEVVNLRVLLLLLVQTVLFTLFFMVLPNRKNRFFDSLPGALLASLGWMIFSELFSVYVERVSGYSSVYGSVYTVALSMLWLYFCLLILFYGGALNQILMEKDE